MSFKMDKNLITGIDDIDSQHQKLFSTIHCLDNDDLDDDKVVQILLEIRCYVVEHFKTEERYMRKYRYPHYEEHKALHESFVNDYNDLIFKFAEDFSISSVLPSLPHVLHNWLITHYGDADVKMTEFLRENMGKKSA